MQSKHCEHTWTPRHLIFVLASGLIFGGLGPPSAFANEPSAAAEEEQPETETQTWQQRRDNKPVGESIMKRVIRSHGKRYLTFQFKPAKDLTDLPGHRASQERDAEGTLLKYMTKAAVRKGEGYRAFRRGASASIRIAGINRPRFAVLDVPQGTSHFIYDRFLPTTLVNGIEAMIQGQRSSVKFLDIDAQTTFTLAGALDKPRVVGDAEGAATELRCGALMRTACAEVKADMKVFAVECKKPALATACVTSSGSVVELKVGTTHMFKVGWSPEAPAPVVEVKAPQDEPSDAAPTSGTGADPQTDPGEGP